jgi:glutathione synthase
MFLVGLDIIGDKLVEINVLTPGGIISATELLKVDFYQPIIDALQHKINVKQLYPAQFSNRQLATI